jgi:hypothetical protein
MEIAMVRCIIFAAMLPAGAQETSKLFSHSVSLLQLSRRVIGKRVEERVKIYSYSKYSWFHAEGKSTSGVTHIIHSLF